MRGRAERLPRHGLPEGTMIRAARRIVDRLRLGGYEAYFAGGWVRDFLLRRKPKDIDIATSAPPGEVRRLFPRSRAIGARFGVVQVSMYGRQFEVTTFRSDRDYLDGRRPSSVVFSGPEEDARRRDFTINGLFYDPADGRLIDYVGGRADIEHRLIRTIGRPRERFREDKLRLLRALRFACSLGFDIVPETWDAIVALAPRITEVSWERIREELAAILTGPDPGRGLELLHRSGLLTELLPEVAVLAPSPHPRTGNLLAHASAVLSRLRGASPRLAFAALLKDVGTVAGAGGAGDDRNRTGTVERICRRLKMSNEDIQAIVGLVETHTRFFQLGEMSRSGWMRLAALPDIEDHLRLLGAVLAAGSEDSSLHTEWRRRLREYRESPPSPPFVDGTDLVALGLRPGPAFREILATVRDLQLEGVLPTREEALRYLRERHGRT